MQATVQRSTLKELVKIFVKEEIGKQIQKECSKIYPLQDNCMVRKVKILKQPKFDLTKLMELYRNQPEAAATEAAPGTTKNALTAWEYFWTQVLNWGTVNNNSRNPYSLLINS